MPVNYYLRPNKLGKDGKTYMAKIEGHRLKIDNQSEKSGIYFINDRHEKMKVEVIGMNTPSQLLFLIPASLPNGTYTLEIRTVIKNAERSSQLSESLVVKSG